MPRTSKPWTAKSVMSLKAPTAGRTRYWDALQRNLFVLATPNGSRTYKARFQRQDGVRIDFRIGPIEGISLSKARERAEDVRKEGEGARKGEDPQSKKRKALAGADTLSKVADECLKALDLRPSTKRQWRGIIENRIKPEFGNRPPREITRFEITRFIERMGEEGVPVLAARTFEVLRRIYSWGVEREDPRVPGTPFVKFKKPVAVSKADDAERDRTLNREEIYRLFKTLESPRVRTWTDGSGEEITRVLPSWREVGFASYIRLLFETAVRREELLRATWSEIDFAGKTFTVPAIRYKAKKKHQVPLTEAALAELRTLKARAGSSHFVFPGYKNRKGAPTTWQMDPSKPLSSPQKLFEELREAVGLSEAWTLHDLRRTASTEMANAGVLPHINEAILGHSLDKLGRTYRGKHNPVLEMRAALEQWSARLKEIIETPPSVSEFPSHEAKGA